MRARTRPGRAGRLLIGVGALVLVAVLSAVAYLALQAAFGSTQSVTKASRERMEASLQLQRRMQMSVMHVHHFHIGGFAEDRVEFAHERAIVDEQFARALGLLGTEDQAYLARARAEWLEAAAIAEGILRLAKPDVISLGEMHARIQRMDQHIMMANENLDALHALDRARLNEQVTQISRDNRQLVLLVVGAFAIALLAATGTALTVHNSQVMFRAMSARDALTGVNNRREFHRQLHRHLAVAARAGRPCSLVLLDVDHFKHVNDTYGHQFGDLVLQTVAARLESVLREADVVARYGGEEFVLILPDTDARNALHVADRARRAVAAPSLTTPNGAPLSLTVSAGTATFAQDAGDADGLVRAADAALYRAKSAGRDRVQQWNPATASS